MSIGDIDITEYVVQEGIKESVQIESNDNSSEESEAESAHYIYEIAALMPSEIKNIIAELCFGSEVFSCIIGEDAFQAEAIGFSASICTETEDYAVWNVQITLSDIEAHTVDGTS